MVIGYRRQAGPFGDAGIMRERHVYSVDTNAVYDGTIMTLGGNLVDEDLVPAEFFISYIKGKGVRDLYLVKIARIGNKAEIHPEGGDKDPRLVFELEYLESLPEYVHVNLNIFRTYRDTLLGRVMGDMIKL